MLKGQGHFQEDLHLKIKASIENISYMCDSFPIPYETTLLSDKPEDSPPTSNAAKYHIRRAFCQAAKLIHASQNWHANLPSPVSSGGFMEVEGRLVPVMTTIEQMPAKLLDILICKCTTSCDTKKCKCQTAGMGCTLLCHKKYNHNNCKNKYNSNSGL